MSKHSKPSPVACFIHQHTNGTNEHVAMSGAYAINAATTHHWAGAVAVAMGYFYLYVSGKSAHKCTLSENN